MNRIKNSAKHAVISEEVIGHIQEEVAPSERFMKPIVVILCDQVYHLVQVRLVVEPFLHSRERLSTEKVESASSRHSPRYEWKDETDWTVDFSENDEIC